MNNDKKGSNLERQRLTRHRIRHLLSEFGADNIQISPSEAELQRDFAAHTGFQIEGFSPRSNDIGSLEQILKRLVQQKSPKKAVASKEEGNRYLHMVARNGRNSYTIIVLSDAY